MFGFAGIKLAKKFRLPHLLEINAPLRWGPKRRIKFPSLAKSMESRIFSSTKGIILTTGELEEYVLGNGGNKEQVWVNPDGVDVDKFHPAISGEKIREEYNLKGKIVVGFVGSIGHWHRVDLLLSVAREVVKKEPEVHFLIVGGAASLAPLKEYVVKNGLSRVVTFTGNVPYEEVPCYIAAMDITVLPGTDIYSSPIKVFEYMAMGKPVIAPRIGQLKEIISEGEEGFLIEQGNKKQLQEGIIKLVGNKTLREKMGQRGRNKVEKEYTWRKNGERICSIYKKLLTGGKVSK
ncbi:MAG: glycosyltransferase family 4 protein [Caldiserica bacterium]|nr:glycosyltransferase family 4 protein [Caldisericota bacterium]